MNIFVDEAGAFNIPNIRKWSVSCVGALVLPEADTERIFRGYKRLMRSWGFFEGELKGRTLNEPEIASLINFLKGFDIIFEVVAIDMIMHSHYQIRKHRLIQADKFTENITEKYHKNLVIELEELKEKLKQLANPLYVQAICTFTLMYNIIQKSSLYYSQRHPEELSNFFWVIDAKDKKITPYENLWTKIVLPCLQSMSIQKPFIRLIDADYSYFEKYCKQKNDTPDYLKDAVGDVKPFNYVEINKIFTDYLYFKQSHTNIGLQLVDILTTSIRRAMNGNLQIQGWGQIGRLMLTSEKKSNTIKFIALGNNNETIKKIKRPPYWDVVSIIDRTCRAIVN